MRRAPEVELALWCITHGLVALAIAIILTVIGCGRGPASCPAHYTAPEHPVAADQQPVSKSCSVQR
jgi:hypothetical protein